MTSSSGSRVPESLLPQPDSALYRNWVMLLNGWGFNWYKLENQLRADDLLIRSRASEHLAAAAAQLRTLEGAFRHKYLPPPSRQHPFPDPARLEQLQRIQAFQSRLAELDTSLRGAAVPGNDQIWARHRNEADTLSRLAHLDTVLVGSAMELAQGVVRYDIDTITGPDAVGGIESHFAILKTALDRRSALLQIQPGSI
jgi:hypothetical protein